MRLPRTLFALAALALAAGALFAADPPKIEPEIRAKPGRLALVTASAPTKIKWVNTNPDLDMIPDSSGVQATLLPAKPGRYKIAVYTGDKTGPSDPAYCTIVVEGDAPTPPVPPVPPGPTPDPTPPKADKLWVFVVMPEARTAAQTKLLTDPAVWSALEAKGHRWRVWPRSSPVVDEKGVGRAADKAGLPAVVIADGSGKFLGARPLPASAAEFADLVKEYAK